MQFIIFTLALFFLFQFPHLFLSGGQISNAPKHHPDVWPHLGSIPAPLSCGAGLETAQEPARLRTAGMERQGWRGKDGVAGTQWQGWRGRDGVAEMLLCRILPCSAARPSWQHQWVGGVPAAGGPGSLQTSRSLSKAGDTLRAAFLGLKLQLSWVLLQIRN